TQQLTSAAYDQFGGTYSVQPTVAWSVNGGGSISASGLFTAGSTGGGPFIVTATASGKSGSASVMVNSSSQPPTITTQPANQTLTAGQTATFSVVASGTPPLSYQWQKNGSNISGATSSS